MEKNPLEELDLTDPTNYKITEYSGLGLQDGFKDNENKFKWDFNYQFDGDHAQPVKLGMSN